MSVKKLERCFKEGYGREMVINNDTVEDRIQNAILTPNDGNLIPHIELTI